MFGLCKKKSEVEKLQEKYERLSAEAYKLSHSNRRAADEKYAEAEQIMDQIEQLKNHE